LHLGCTAQVDAVIAVDADEQVPQQACAVGLLRAVLFKGVERGGRCWAGWARQGLVELPRHGLQLLLALFVVPAPEQGSARARQLQRLGGGQRLAQHLDVVGRRCAVVDPPPCAAGLPVF